MNKLYISFIQIILLTLISLNVYSQNEVFNMRQLACDLSQPWEIKFGPDGYLWVTEARTYQVRRIDPITGNAQLMLDLSGKKNFPDYHEANEFPQGGLQGIAFHNDFHTNPYFYVAYVYHFEGCLPDTQGCYYRTKIARYNYDLINQSFSNELVIADSIPGSSDHNGGRLVVAPITANMDYLFYSVGDMAAGHGRNRARKHHGQQIESYEGKILRYNLKPDTDADSYSRWIPNDNPFNHPSIQSAVWSLGHRNPQGLVFSPEGILYESEHGPYSDDEINIIKRGYNYGFPLIMGFTDGNYDDSRSGAGSGAPPVISEAANRVKIELNFPYSDPIGSFFAVSKAEVTTIYNNDYNDTPPYPNYYLQWPTSAPSGIDYYHSDAIPGWKNSLLMANLKLANVYRLKLSNDGARIVSDTIAYFQGLGRFRDIAISSDGSKIYVSTDTAGSIKGAPGLAVVPPNKGCILEFSYITTSTDDVNQNDFVNLYPNPSSGYFTLVLSPEISTADFTLSTISGEKKLIAQLKQNKTIFNTRDLHPGIYVIKVVHNLKTWGEKLIIR